MTHAPKIAVLLATYNGANWVCQQIDSILSQTNVNLTLFVADDASTDQTLEIIKGRYVHNPKVILTSLIEKVGSASRNFQRLLCHSDYADFDFIAFADQDDLWDKDKLEIAVMHLEEKHASGYSCAVKAFWHGGKSQILSQSQNITELDYFFEGAGQGCTFVFRRELLLLVQKAILSNLKLCHQIHYHDWLLYAIARTHNHIWFFDQVPHMLYRQHAANDTGSKGTLAGVKFRLKKLRNGWYFNQVKLILELINRESLLDINAKGLIVKLFDNEKSSLSLKDLLKIYLNARRKFSDRLIVFCAILLRWNKRV